MAKWLPPPHPPPILSLFRSTRRHRAEVSFPGVSDIGGLSPHTCPRPGACLLAAGALYFGNVYCVPETGCLS